MTLEQEVNKGDFGKRMNVIDELEDLAMVLYGDIVDVAEVWVSINLINNAIAKEFITLKHGRELATKLNKVMKDCGEFPIKMREVTK